MKFPKTVNRLCPMCRKHTESKLVQAKNRTPGSSHPLARYMKHRSGFGHGYGNLGKLGSKPALSKFKMTGAKTSKKIDLRYECKICKKQHVQRVGFRVKKVEFQWEKIINFFAF